MPAPVRVANASGFYGDRFAAMREMLDGGAARRAHRRLPRRADDADPRPGPAQGPGRRLRARRSCARWRSASARRSSAASGSSPTPAGSTRPGWPTRCASSPQRLGLDAPGRARRRRRPARRGRRARARRAAHRQRLPRRLGHRRVPDAGADIVVTGRVTDASLVVGAGRRALRLGAATTATRWPARSSPATCIECGAQATGGNYAFFTEHRRPGAPRASRSPRSHADGSRVITKHAGTGGAVTVETVTAQLLYEIGGAALRRTRTSPPASTRIAAGRRTARTGCAITGVRGEPPPPTLKVCLNPLGGFRNEMTFVLTGLDIEAKADAGPAPARGRPGDAARRASTWTLARTDHPDADTEEAASALLHVRGARTATPTGGRPGVQRSAAVELALAQLPRASTSPRRPATPARTACTAPALRAADAGRARRGAARRRRASPIAPPTRHAAARAPARRRPRPPDRCRRARPGAPPLGTRRRRAQRRQGRRREPRRLGAHRRGLRAGWPTR